MTDEHKPGDSENAATDLANPVESPRAQNERAGGTRRKRVFSLLQQIRSLVLGTPSGSNTHRIVMQSSASAVCISENSGAWMEGE